LAVVGSGILLEDVMWFPIPVHTTYNHEFLKTDNFNVSFHLFNSSFILIF